MNGHRLEAAKEAAKLFIHQLQPDDEVSLVTYDDSVSVPLELLAVKGFKPLLPELLSSIDAGGSTNLHAGWLEGAQQLAPRSGKDRMCRVILLSDGKANAGIKNIDTICEQVSHLAAAGVTTSTVGIGLDFNERLMTAMAIAGQGTAMYGDRASDLSEPLEAEAGLLSALAWREVSLKLQSESTSWMVHNPYSSHEPETWILPSLASNSEAWVALSIPMDCAVEAQRNSGHGSALSIAIRAKNNEGTLYTFEVALPPLPIVSEAEYDALIDDPLVRRRFNEIEAADLQREAYRAANQRNWSKISRMLDELELRARDNPWLMQTVAVLRRLLEEKDQARLEKELMYSSHSMSARLTEHGESLNFSESTESGKAAFLRRKIQQGRQSGSQQ
jgi:Ca-activated chloride channel family protein